MWAKIIFFLAILSRAKRMSFSKIAWRHTHYFSVLHTLLIMHLLFMSGKQIYSLLSSVLDSDTLLLSSPPWTPFHQLCRKSFLCLRTLYLQGQLLLKWWLLWRCSVQRGWQSQCPWTLTLGGGYHPIFCTRQTSVILTLCMVPERKNWTVVLWFYHCY